MSPQYALFHGDMGSREIHVQAESIAEAIRIAEKQTGAFVICGTRIS